jgi:DNA-binding response OmpR family regulator
MLEAEKQRVSEQRSLDVLIVDPDEDAAAMIEGVLTPRGHRVTRTGSLSEARTLCGRVGYHVLITALRLPDGDASELLVDGGLCCKVPAIVLSSPGDSPPAPGVRFASHLTKPVAFDVLRATILRVVDAA